MRFAAEPVKLRFDHIGRLADRREPAVTREPQ
jgi:hypothetical protein